MSPLQHRLAAILAADAAGYSRLMSIDDKATVAALDAARVVFHQELHSHQGRVIDRAGDSVLATSTPPAARSVPRWRCRPNSRHSWPASPKTAACAFASACISAT
jgi:class 3 adenylate cyclase